MDWPIEMDLGYHQVAFYRWVIRAKSPHDTRFAWLGTRRPLAVDRLSFRDCPSGQHNVDPDGPIHLAKTRFCAETRYLTAIFDCVTLNMR